MALLIENNAYSRVAASLAAGGTTLIVDTGTGDRFPIAGSGNYFKLTLQDAANNIEIIKVNARAASSDSMTIERAQEGTTARAWSIGDIVELRLTAGVTAPLQVLEEANTAALIRGKIDVPSRSGVDATGTWGISITGNAATATALQNARLIGGVSFNGTANIDLPGVNVAGNQSTSGNAATSTTLQTARAINGVLFNGSANIVVEPFIERDDATAATRYLTFVDSSVAGHLRLNMDLDLGYNPSTNTMTTNVTGNSGTATALQTARTINGVSFNGTANITLTANTPNNLTFNNAGTGGGSGSAFNGGAALTVSYNTIGAPSTTGAGASGTWGISITGNAATATTATNANNINSVADDATNATHYPVFLGAQAGNQIPNTDINFTYNPGTNTLTAGTFAGALSGNATTATTLQTARTINGVSFNGSANISVNLNNSLTAGNGLTGTAFNGSAAQTFALGTPTSVSNTSTDSVTATSHTHALVGELVETTSGVAPYYGARAFVNFNGTGVVAIRNSQGVSSITDNDIGAYTVNLSVAMPDVNYTVVGSAGAQNSASTITTLFKDQGGNLSAPLTTSFRIITSFDSGAGQRLDNEHVCLSVFR